MSTLSIRQVNDDDYDEIATELSAYGKLTTAEETREKSARWMSSRNGKVYVALEEGHIVGTAGISPSRHMDDAVSVGAQYFDGTRDLNLYRALLREAYKAGASVATCTVAPGDESEHAVWEQLGADFKSGRRDCLHPVLILASV